MLVKISNGQVERYPYSTNQLMRDNPNVSFPKNISEKILNAYGVFTVKRTPPPSDIDTRTHTYTETVELVDGVWTQVWTVIRRDEDRVVEQLRNVRNALLMQTDWTQGKDIDDTVSNKWAAYRQDLRDLPQQQGFPWDVVWPTEPK